MEGMTWMEFTFMDENDQHPWKMTNIHGSLSWSEKLVSSCAFKWSSLSDFSVWDSPPLHWLPLIDSELLETPLPVMFPLPQALYLVAMPCSLIHPSSFWLMQHVQQDLNHILCPDLGFRVGLRSMIPSSSADSSSSHSDRPESEISSNSDS